MLICSQDQLRPLQEIIPAEWNRLSRPASILDWLGHERSEEDACRMHTLGNIVVPLQGTVGWHVLLGMFSHKET
jgi:hypothetical protein